MAEAMAMPMAVESATGTFAPRRATRASRASSSNGLRRQLVAIDVLGFALGWTVTLPLVAGVSVTDPGVVPLLATIVVISAVCAAPQAPDTNAKSYSGHQLHRVVMASIVGGWVSHYLLVSGPIDAAAGAGAALGTVVCGRYLFEEWLDRSRARGRNVRRVVLVGTTSEVAKLHAFITDNPELGLSPVAVACDDGGPAIDGLVPFASASSARAAAVATNASGVVVAANSLSSDALNDIVRDVVDGGLHLFLSSGLVGLGWRRLQPVPLGHEPFVYVEPGRASRAQEIAKRAVDIAVAFVLLVLTAPLLVVAAIAIKLGDGGPVLFRQTRIGRDGRPFRLHKLRTMVVDAEARLDEIRHLNEREGPLFKVAHDPRITRVGRFLRASSIDELPQLFDVLAGRMSMVGPRPALPNEFDSFDTEMLTRMQVRPGVTGMWQLESRDKPSFKAYRRLDLYYVENWTLGLDLSILASTVPNVVMRTFRALRASELDRSSVATTTQPNVVDLREHRAPHVAIVVQNMPVPLDRRVWLECQTLVANGYRVSVVCPKGPGDPSREFVEGVELLKYRPAPAARGTFGYFVEFGYCWLRTAAVVRRLHRRDPIDALQACNPPDTYWLLARWAKRWGVRFVFDHHDLCPELYRSRGARPAKRVLRVLEWLERKTYDTADLVLTTNESYRAVACRRTGYPADAVTVVRSGPDPDRMRRVTPTPSLRNGRTHLVCYLGLMGPQDGVDIVIRAADVVVHELGREDIQFGVLGYGDCLDDLRRLCTELRLDSHVTFTGRVEADEITAWLSTAAVGISPDPRTVFNDVSTMNKTLEYMAFELPVVAFDLTETMVSAGAAAAYAESSGDRGSDIRALATLLVELIDDVPRRASMGRIGRERIEDGLGWPTSAARYVTAYDDMLGRVRGDRQEPPAAVGIAVSVGTAGS